MCVHFDNFKDWCAKKVRCLTTGVTEWHAVLVYSISFKLTSVLKRLVGSTANRVRHMLMSTAVCVGGCGRRRICYLGTTICIWKSLQFEGLKWQRLFSHVMHLACDRGGGLSSANGVALFAL